MRGASPVRLVITLYEQLIEDLRRAVIAQETGALERRTNEVNHAFQVIAHLQATLDLERGGEVARNLANFYTSLRVKLTEALARQSAPLIEEQIGQLVMVHEAWVEVEGATAGHGEGSPVRSPESAPVPTPAIFATDWRA